MHPDLLDISGYSIQDVIEFAYAVPNEQEFAGGPGWIRTEPFDIAAKTSEVESARLARLSTADQHTQMRLMLQSLLRDRLHLRVSFPTKDLPLFDLVVAKGGYKCTINPSDSSTASAGPPPPPPPPLSSAPPPGQEPEVWRREPIHMVMRSWPFPQLVAWMTGVPELGGRIVVDETGIRGATDCEVTWAHEGADVPAPSFFTAIQEQMGLKLQPDKGPIETVFVEHIERPTPN